MKGNRALGTRVVAFLKTDFGTAGWFNSTPATWTTNGFAECNLLFRLYRLSDSDQLFADGFD